MRVLETALRLTHPFMPYITEEIWQSVKGMAGTDGDSIMQQAWPVSDASKIDAAASAQIAWVKEFIMGIRRIRSEMDIKPGQALDILIQNWSVEDRALHTETAAFTNTLAKVNSVDWLASDAEAPESATALVGEMNVLIPLAGLIDKDAEIARLEKEIAKLEKGLVGLEGRLNNPNFTERAKPEVVAKAQEQAEEQRTALAQLQGQLGKIQAL